MRLERTPFEELVDGLLTLALFHLAAPEGPVGTRLKAAKLTFIPSLAMFQDRVRAFNFSFYRYTWGPFSKQLYETWEDLQWAGLLILEPGGSGKIFLTPEGHEIAQDFIDEVLSMGENQSVLEVLSDVAQRHGRANTTTLLKRVYDIDVTPIGIPERMRIGAAPMGVYFTIPVEERLARKTLQVPHQWLVKLDESLQRAKAMSAGRQEAIRPEILDDVAAAVAADDRGEGTRLTADEMDKIKRQHGIA